MSYPNMKNYIYIPAARAVVRAAVQEALDTQVATIPEPEAKQVARIVKALGRDISKSLGTLRDETILDTLSHRKVAETGPMRGEYAGTPRAPQA